jgi:ribonuclease III
VTGVHEAERLYQRLGHRFRDRELANMALTHRSCGPRNNERLEFLGDALLSAIIAEFLYHRFADIPEGDLSRMRATLVKGKTLAQIARELELGDNLRLGSGELKSGGQRRDSILADAVEALIGAIYLDGGLERCRECVLRWYESRLTGDLAQEMHKDAKTRLQEYLQAQNQPLPSYRVVDVGGEAHRQEFKVECDVSLLGESVLATGSSRKGAEQNAAARALRELKVDA